MSPETLVTFWSDAGPQKWFAKDDAFDADLRTHFEAAHQAAARGAFAEWEERPEGALALLLLLDQIPRNIYRGSAHAFATDARAREVATRAIAQRFDEKFEAGLRCFFYLPYEHSESAEDQARAIALYEILGDAEFLKYAILHRDIIARFGRFPHRNAVMGRVSTPEEQAYLDGGGFAG
jgi:uncharacterized protein (DUF924 family)